MTRRVEFEILYHGCDGESYFPGCGVCGSRYEHVVTGIGESAREAARDAYEQMEDGMAWWPSVDDTAAVEKAIEALPDIPLERTYDACEDRDCDGCEGCNSEWHHYVSIRWRAL